ncbi:vWA domain-containing protein [Solibacillus silvestris]|uniref:vWA domain-containing protein n=1 Tax=Solibacillus silvestris TaxID=76853 RepID=UPI003F8111AF
MAKLLNDSCLEGEKVLAGFTNLIGDCWYAFYNKKPLLKDNAEQFNDMQYTFLKHLLENEEYMQWHELTKGDELLSVLTSISIADQLLKSLKQLNGPKEAIRYEQIYERQKQSAEQSVLHREPQMKTYIKQLSKTSIGTMLQENKRKIRNTKKAIVTVGTMDGKKIENIPLSDQFELAAMIGQRKELRLIADLVGRFKKIAMKKQKAKHAQTMACQNISFGQEVSRLLPAELGNYMMKHSKLDFLKRFSEQQTLIFDTNGKDRKGKGPIIICIDESSSMTTIKEQSKAFCIALLMIAKKQKRDFAIVPFATNVGDVKFFRKGQATTQDLIHFSNSFLGGGTNYELPLRESLNILLRSEFTEADLLFVTDGSSFLPAAFIDEFNRSKKQKQFECTAVVLTNFFNAVDLNVVHKFSDRVIEVNDLFDAGDAFAL